MIGCLKSFSRNDAGSTAIEYSLIAGLVALMIIAALTQVGADLLALLQGAADGL